MDTPTQSDLAHLATISKLNNFESIIKSKLFGLEKESLRVSQQGILANNNHPKPLGAALTNPKITTDYAESQLELITQPYSSPVLALQELFETHCYVYSVLNPQQVLWPLSIPGNLPAPRDINIAKYGKSVAAQFKELYRLGLSYRYGKTMQLISGIHFNFSFGKEFWQAYFTHCLHKPHWNQDDVDEAYIHIIKNYLRISWLVSYLFGASPVINKDFITKDIAVANYLKPFKDKTYLAEYGITVRESNNLGYHNKDNLDLLIDYNSINNYANSLLKAISTEDKDFLELGKYRSNKPIQINCNRLQIENEYYGKIRPKPDINIREMPLYKALKNHGISYIELRNIDLNPYKPIGIDYEQCLLLELIINYCLFRESPELSIKERAKIKANNEKVALLGRQPGLLLSRNGSDIELKNWAKDIFKDLEIIAQYFDQVNNKDENSIINSKIDSAPNLKSEQIKHISYTQVLKKYSVSLDNPCLLPSAQIHQELVDKNLDYTELFLNKAIDINNYFLDNPLSKSKYMYYQELAQKSIEQLQAEEKRDKTKNQNLEEFISQYYSLND